METEILEKNERKRREGRPVVYLDETWANTHDGHIEHGSHHRSNQRRNMKPSGKGNHLIILHAGSEDAWIKGEDLVSK